MPSGWVNGSTYAHRKAREQVMERDGYLCRIRLPGCTEVATQAHHVHGKSVTGDDPALMVAACAWCNQRVGDPRATDPQPTPRTRW